MKKRIICIIISIFLLITAIAVRVIANYEESCSIFVANTLKGDLTQEINTAIIKKFQNIDSESFRQIELSQNGNIGSIAINTREINILCNELSNDIHQIITQRKNHYGMPMGNTLDLAYLSGIGPEIGVNVIPNGYVEYKIGSNLKSAGINQSLYTINAEFKVSIRCLAPFHETQIEISVPMIISETLIVGKVPEILFAP